ncbi:MAG: hypothetical protein ACK56I_35685 [bacterium]
MEPRSPRGLRAALPGRRSRLDPALRGARGAQPRAPRLPLGGGPGLGPARTLPQRPDSGPYGGWTIDAGRRGWFNPRPFGYPMV